MIPPPREPLSEMRTSERSSSEGSGRGGGVGEELSPRALVKSALSVWVADGGAPVSNWVPAPTRNTPRTPKKKNFVKVLNSKGVEGTYRISI